MNKINIILIGAGLLFGQTAFASDECGKLSILLVNTTQSTCKLMDYNLIHGYIINASHIPTYIPAGTTSPALDLEQSIRGPEIKMAYQCGDNKTITLYSKQDYCFTSAGKIRAQILNKQDMNAEYTAKEGSGLWNQHGTLSWILTD